PTMPSAGEAAPNHLTMFVAKDGALSYELLSRKNGKSSGKIDLDKPLITGWADWQLVVDKTLPHAEQWMDFRPAKSETATSASGAGETAPGGRGRGEKKWETIGR